MATLDSLKRALKQKATETASSPKQSISDTQYHAGYDILSQGSGWLAYQDFIIPQLSELLATLLNSRTHISMLEIGPGPRSVLGYLPRRLRQKVRINAAFEPNTLFATAAEWLNSTGKTEAPLSCLERPPDIYRVPFVLNGDTGSNTGTDGSVGYGKFDVVLFCHSMYGMKPKARFIERALDMLVERP